MSNKNPKTHTLDLRNVGYIVLIGLITATAYAQTTWFKTYGGYHVDVGFDLNQTADGGYIIVGTTHSFGAGSDDIYLIKTDSVGDPLWAKTYGGSRSDHATCVQQTSDLGYMIVGWTLSINPGYKNVYLVKTDENGDSLWARTYGVGNGCSGQQTRDGGYILTGYHYTPYRAFLIKTDSRGDTLWTKIYSSNYIEKGFDVQQTDDGGYILTGAYAALVKTDSLGNLIWSKILGPNNGYSVRQTQDGGYIVTGRQYIPGSWESRSRVFLVKADASGDTLWTRKLGDIYSAGYCVRQTRNGGYIITGREDMDYINLIKTDTQGYVIWSKKLDLGEGQSVRQTNDGGYIITGKLHTENKGYQVFLIKTDNSGNITGINDQNNCKKESPQHFKLHHNYPNPFNQSTMIVYEISGRTQDLRLVIYDLTGKEVRTLLEKSQSQGIYSIPWDGRDDRGREVTSGVYLVHLEGGGGRWKVNKKLLLIR